VFHGECSFSKKSVREQADRRFRTQTDPAPTRCQTEEAVEAHWPPLTPEHGFPSQSITQTQGAPPQPVTRSRFLSVAHRLSGLFARIRRCFPLQSTKDCCGKSPCLRAKILAIRRTPLTKTASKQKTGDACAASPVKIHKQRYDFLRRHYPHQVQKLSENNF